MAQARRDQLTPAPEWWRLVGLLAGLAAGCATYLGHPGDGQPRVLVCHKGKTLEIAAPALDAHLRHGDYRGPCH